MICDADNLGAILASGFVKPMVLLAIVASVLKMEDIKKDGTLAKRIIKWCDGMEAKCVVET